MLKVAFSSANHLHKASGAVDAKFNGIRCCRNGQAENRISPATHYRKQTFIPNTQTQTSSKEGLIAIFGSLQRAGSKQKITRNWLYYGKAAIGHRHNQNGLYSTQELTHV